MESHWEVKKGEFALKYITLPHGRKYISNTSLATRRTSIDYRATRLFCFVLVFTTTFIFHCAHQNEKSLHLRKTTSLHLPLSLPGETFSQEKLANCTHQEAAFAVGHVHSSYVKGVHCPHFSASICLVCPRYH